MAEETEDDDVVFDIGDSLIAGAIEIRWGLWWLGFWICCGLIGHGFFAK